MHEDKKPLITHPLDPQFQFLRSLQTEKGRNQTGRYLIEGVRHVARAFEERSPIEQLFVDRSVLNNPFGQKLARRIRQAGIPEIRLTSQRYRELTLALEPQGIGAVVRQHWFSLSRVKSTAHGLWLAAESVDQPGNLGTIIRTAEAAGVEGMFLLGDGADPWDTACVRATMGALFSMKLIRCTNREFTDWARTSRVRIIGSSPMGLLSYKAVRHRGPIALLIGSEKVGFSSELMDAADFTVRIPMHGRSDSINAAVATGVLLFELASREF